MKHPLPSPDYVVFAKPALALVLCQVRFPVLPRFPDPDYVDGFYQAVRTRYPKSQRTAQVAFPILAEHTAGQLPSSLLWRFSSIDDKWTLVVTENALTLESREYRALPEFLDRFIWAVERLLEALNPALQVRLGLRYINEFRIPGAGTLGDWKAYIREEALGLTAIAPEVHGGGTVAYSRQEFELRLPNGSLVIRHGLHSGTTVEPAELAQMVQQTTQLGPCYLLDMDRSESRQRPIEPEQIRSRLAEFNMEVYRFFRWAILDPLYEALEPSDVG